MLLVRDIRLPLSAGEQEAVAAALKKTGLPRSGIAKSGIAKLSVDARHGRPNLVYTVALELAEKGAERSFEHFAPYVSIAAPVDFKVQNGTQHLAHPPVVCGLGPAGLFAALLLARQGFCPVVLERGPAMEERTRCVEQFNKTGVLNENANIQFGEGGAGTFSDGKLTTRISDPLCAFVTKTLLQHGAPEDIAYKQRPHIGTDELRGVITSIRREIESLGGRVCFNTPLTGLSIENGVLRGVKTPDGEIPCEALVLAPGHSARDTFEMLGDAGFELHAKSFSVGFRAEHLQSKIERSLYHDAAGHPALVRGEYQLSHHVGSRCVYTFCMCPGGSVVAAASETGRAVTNGMSLHARDGRNANAAVVVSVNENDFGGDARKAIAFQRELEEKAYRAGGGGYAAPAENVQSFLRGEGRLHISQVEPTYPRGVTAYDLGSLLPEELTSALRTGLSAFERRLSGYTAPEAVLTGLETRTSSPVRLRRNETGESTDVEGVWPCGEGPGYAGGIMSAAVDGLRCASRIAGRYSPDGTGRE